MRVASVILFLFALAPVAPYNARIGLMVRLRQADGKHLTFDWVKVAACGLLAVHHINNRISDVVANASTLPVDFNVTAFVEDTSSLPSEAARQANLFAVVEGVDIIIGPSRSAETGPAAIVAGAHDVPLLSYLASSPALSNKQVYPLFSRTALMDTNRAEVTMSTISHMGWRKMAIIYRFDLVRSHPSESNTLLVRLTAVVCSGVLQWQTCSPKPRIVWGWKLR